MIEFSRDKMEAPLDQLFKFNKSGKKSDLPQVSANTPVDSIIEVALQYPHKKSVYVVNEDKSLIGLITIRDLMRNLFSIYHKPQAHSRRIIEMITAESAEEIMIKEMYFVEVDSTIEETLHYMTKGGIYSIPIVDKNKRLLHEISLRDILRFLVESP